MKWTVHVSGDQDGWSAYAKGDSPEARALAETHRPCGVLHSLYGIPEAVPALRFMRIRAYPQGEGGGSTVLRAILKMTDLHGFWTALEASPYAFSKFSEDELIAFYEHHGFKVIGDRKPLMVRPPGGSLPRSPA